MVWEWFKRIILLGISIINIEHWTGKIAPEKVETVQKYLKLVDCRNSSLAGIYNAT